MLNVPSSGRSIIRFGSYYFFSLHVKTVESPEYYSQFHRTLNMLNKTGPVAYELGDLLLTLYSDMYSLFS